MKTNIKTQLKRDPDYNIHVSTIEVRSSKDPENIADKIVDIAKNRKNDNNKILISNTVPHRDNLNGKGRWVNKMLLM